MVQFDSESDQRNDKSCTIVLDRLDSNEVEKLMIFSEAPKHNNSWITRSKS